MPRKRRASTSTTESAHEDCIVWHRESSILLPAGPVENDWPIFELNDAVVLDGHGNALANALDVLLKGPFIVRGNMIIEDDGQKEYLIPNKTVGSSLPVEIRPCSRYSIGEGGPEDKSKDLPILWVAGYGGWFEINPSPSYLPIYRDICHAIKLYYIIHDIYHKNGIRMVNKKSKSLDPIERLAFVFRQYSLQVGDGSIIEEVAERCNKFSSFLFCQFLETPEDHDWWKATYFYTWLTDNHKDLFAKTLKALPKSPGAKTTTTTVASPTTTTTTSTATATSSSTSLPTRVRQETPIVAAADITKSAPDISRHRSTRSPSIVEIPDSSEASPESTQQDDSMGDLAMDLASDHIKLPSSPPQFTTPPQGSTHHTQPHSTTETASSRSKSADSPLDDEDESSFQSVLGAFVDVLHRLPSAYEITETSICRRMYMEWAAPEYRTGEVGSYKTPMQEILHYNAARLLKALDQDASKYQNTELYRTLQQRSKTEFVPVAMKLSDFPFRLLPRKKKLFTPTALHIRHDYDDHVDDDYDDDDDDDDIRAIDTPRSRSGKGMKNPGRILGKSGLRLATSSSSSSKKRPYADIENSSESSDSIAKRSHFFSATATAAAAAEDEVMTDEVEAESSEAAEDQDLPIRVVIRAERIPSERPTGPHGTWVCQEDDCKYIVRGGSRGTCQQRIRQHFKRHEDEQAQERVSLAMTEGSRGHLPINHLLDKIKRLGDQDLKKQQTAADGMDLPDPIKTSVIV